MINSWKKLIDQESNKDYYKKLMNSLQEESKQYIIYPPHKDLFKAFKLTPLNKVRVVILAMDPYINPNQAHGLAFSVKSGEAIPPSLRNIFNEIKTDLNAPTHSFSSGCLTSWAEQGVLLLNTTLTVRAGQSGSHQGLGWETFTDEAIKTLNKLDRPIVFILLGRSAQNKGRFINNTKHFVRHAAHPSPLSAWHGFVGCKVFSQANKFLIDNNLTPIQWLI